MPSVSRVSCPGCQNALRVPDEWLDQQIRCKKCGRKFRPRTAIVPPPVASADIPVAGTDTIRDEAAALAPPELDPWSFAAVPNSVASRYRPATRSRSKFVAVASVGLLIAAAGTIGLYYQGIFGKAGESANQPSEAAVTGNEAKKSGKTTDRPAALDNFPRRMLVVSINNYLYANSTSAGKSGRGVADATKLFAAKLLVPKEQYYLVTDGLPDQDARSPLKSVVEQSIERYLATCRAQDRIVLVYAGHALDVDDQPYLVPLEGDTRDKDSLIPLQWLFDRLAMCPARQKLLIFDACRIDSARGQERPGSGPMGPKLDAMLAAPPAGVQIWSSCVGKQFSYEYEYALIGNAHVHGGAFLGLLMQAFQQGGGIQKAEDALPLDFLVKQVNAPTAALAKSRENAEQTPRLSGAVPAEGAAYDPAQPAAARFELPRAESLMAGGRADPKLVQSIFAEVAVPPLRLPRDADKALTPDQQAAQLAAIFPFQADAIQPFAADYKNMREIMATKGKYPLREAVIRAVEALDRQGRLNKVKAGNIETNADALIDKLKSAADDGVKKSLTETQKSGPAKMLFELSEAHEAMQEVEKQRDQESSKRWQAHFNYVFAQLKARMVYVNEYNMVIAKVKKDELPALDPKLHNGWRLAADEKIQSPKEVKDLAAERKRLLDKLIKDYPGTPWEVLAKRERFTVLGLAWKPANFAGE